MDNKLQLLPKCREEFAQKDYWDNFFKKRSNKSFEWYGEYPELCEHLHKYIKPKDELLVVGCGNSTLSSSLYDTGNRNITNIDISNVVIKQMQKLHAKKRPDMKHLVMDVFDLTFEADSFSVLLDKGTLDALAPNDDPETVEKINGYFDQISKVLRNGGRYLCVSLLQEHVLRMLVNYFPVHNWMFRIVRCVQAEKSNDSDNSFPVFMIVCTKFKALPQMILEVDMTSENKMQRLSTAEEVATCVAGVQRSAFICSGLRQHNLANQEEVSFDLYKQEDQENARFTLYIVDITSSRKNTPYAAFIVPQKREAEWIFGSPKGRKFLTRSTKCNRLAIVTMHKGQKYGNMNSVQDEVSEAVKNMAPRGHAGKITFLSLGVDPSLKKLQFEGESKVSGDYFIEDEFEEGRDVYRRLLHVDSLPDVYCTTKLLSAKENTVDYKYLKSEEHILMSVCAHTICSTNPSASLSLIGVGCGTLFMFLQNLFSESSCVGVTVDEDISNIGKKWFGLQCNEKFVLYDKIDYGKTYDAILIDIDEKFDLNATITKQLLGTSLSDSLAEDGLLVVNVSNSNKSFIQPFVRTLEAAFSPIVSYPLEDSCKIVLYGKTKLSEKPMRKKMKDSYRRVKAHITLKNKSEHLSELDSLIDDLKIN